MRRLNRRHLIHLAGPAGFEACKSLYDHYRSGVLAALFPNRLELSLRWRPV